MPDNTIKSVVREIVREEMRFFGVSLKEEIVLAVKDTLASFRSDMVSLKDEIVGELQTFRDEETISSGKVRLINELDDRVEKLEKIHPQSSHQPATA